MDNPVFKAYQVLVSHKEALRNDDRSDLEALEDMIQEIQQANRKVWLAVYEETKEINPSLIRDIEVGQYDNNMTTSDLCYLDRNWGVLNSEKCPHCGNIHKK